MKISFLNKKIVLKNRNEKYGFFCGSCKSPNLNDKLKTIQRQMEKKMFFFYFLVGEIKPVNSAMTQPSEYASNSITKPTEYSSKKCNFRTPIFQMI